LPSVSDSLTRPADPAAPVASPAAAPDGRQRLGRLLSGAALLALAVAVLSFPAWAPNPYVLSAGVVVLNYAVLSTSWNFVGGFTGYISLGHGALAGLGGYATGLLVVRAGLPSFVALAVAGLLVAAFAVPVGYAALRVRGASFVIVSIALVLILLLVFQSWASVTGGSRGLVVPRPFPDLLRPEHHRVFYYLFAVLLGVALLVWWLIDRSRFGLGLKAIREDEDKAESLGTPTFGYKLVVFVVSAGFTGLAGGLYALWFGDLDPVFQFSILTGAYLVLMALLGGVRHLFGPVVGALVVGVALEYFKVEFGDTQLHLVATGVLLALVVLFMPDGVLPALGGLRDRYLRPAQASIREVTAAELWARRAAESGSTSTVTGPAPTDPAGSGPAASGGVERATADPDAPEHVAAEPGAPTTEPEAR
jgi:branched-chain amino acid transport system permease protein